MYSNILVAVDVEELGTVENSFALAKQVASKDGKVTAINVVEEIPTYVYAQLPPEIVEARVKNAAEALEECVSKTLPEAGHHVLHGHVANSILDYAERNEIDLIVVASHKPGMMDYLLGSTAARLVRHAKCSVLVTR